MKNTAPHQNAHLHSQKPSPACGETGSPKGGRRDENPMPIPLGHRPLPIVRREKTFLKTANNPSSRLREEVSRSDGGGQKTPVCPACVRFILRMNALTPTPLPQAGEGFLFVLSAIFSTIEMYPLGDSPGTQHLSRLAVVREPSICLAWRQSENPAFVSLGGCPRTQHLSRLAIVQEPSISPAWQ